MAGETNTGDVDADVLARVLNVSVRRLQQLAKEGVIPRSGKGKYPFLGAVRGYVVYLQQTAGASDIDPDQLEPFKRRAHYQAEHEKLILGVKSGELLPRAEVEREFARVFDILARFLDVLPDRAERAGLATPALAEQLVAWSNGTRTELYEELFKVPPDESATA